MRPTFEEYFMEFAKVARLRANCKGRHVGAVLVRDRQIISAGYNGTPAGMRNCEDGGCARCSCTDPAIKGKDYDRCICVHAEANAVLHAAKLGIRVDGASLYTTLQPCFVCLRDALQAGVVRVVYEEPINYSDLTSELRDQYIALCGQYPGLVLQYSA